MMLWALGLAWAMPVHDERDRFEGPDRHETALHDNVLTAVIQRDRRRLAALLAGRLEPDPAVIVPPFRPGFGLPLNPIGVATSHALEGRDDGVLALVAPHGDEWTARFVAGIDDLPPIAKPVLERLIGARVMPALVQVVAGRAPDADVSWVDELVTVHGTPSTACDALVQGDLWLLARLRDRLPDQCELPGRRFQASELLAVETVGRLQALGSSVATPCTLRHAALTSNLDSLEWLLAQGVDPDGLCGAWTALDGAATPPAVAALLAAGAEPFPVDHVPRGHDEPEVLAKLLEAPTRLPERRLRVITHGWLTGRNVDLVGEVLPEALAGQPAGTLPDLSMSALRLAIEAAGGLEELVAARGDAPFGSPIPPPCVLPVRADEAIPLLGESWVSDHGERRETRGPRGVVVEERVRGRWRMVRWSVDSEACPALEARWAMMPVIAGASVRLTDGRVIAQERTFTMPERVRWSIVNSLDVDGPTRRAMVDASRRLEISFRPLPAPRPEPAQPLPPQDHPALESVVCELDPPPSRTYPIAFPPVSTVRADPGWSSWVRSPFGPRSGYRLEPHDVDLTSLWPVLVEHAANELGYDTPPSLDDCPAGTTAVHLGRSTLTANRSNQGIEVRFEGPLLPDLPPERVAPASLPPPAGIRGRVFAEPVLYACDTIPGDAETCADGREQQRLAWESVAHLYPQEGVAVEVVELAWTIQVAAASFDEGLVARLVATPRPLRVEPQVPIQGDGFLRVQFTIEDPGNLGMVFDAITGERLPWQCNGAWMDVRDHVAWCERMPAP